MIANLQCWSLSRTVTGAPPVGKLAARNEASLASRHIRRPLLNMVQGSRRLLTHTRSIVKVAYETTSRHTGSCFRAFAVTY